MCCRIVTSLVLLSLSLLFSRPSSNLSPIHLQQPRHPNLVRRAPLVRKPKAVQSIKRKHAQPHRQRLATLERPRNARASKQNARRERKLDAVRLAVADAVAADAVLRVFC